MEPSTFTKREVTRYYFPTPPVAALMFKASSYERSAVHDESSEKSWPSNEHNKLVNRWMAISSTPFLSSFRGDAIDNCKLQDIASELLIFVYGKRDGSASIAANSASSDRENESSWPS